MGRILIANVLWMVLVACGGCASSDLREAQGRLERTAAPMAQSDGKSTIRFQVVKGTVPEAFSWSDGRIVCSMGLMRVVSDEELAAAVAHELGHLRDHRHSNGAAGLAGGLGWEQKEFEADDHAVGLLMARGIDPAAMETLLAKIAAGSGLSRESRGHLAGRIERLRKRKSASSN